MADQNEDNSGTVDTSIAGAAIPPAAPPATPASNSDAIPVTAVNGTVAAFTNAERNPSSWAIFPTDDENAIEARHNSGRVFIGSQEEFSALLRGE